MVAPDRRSVVTAKLLHAVSHAVMASASLPGSFSTGVATRSGGDYDIYSLTYVYAW